jgi:hypothetical protein
MCNDRGEHVIVDQLFGCALEKAKRPKQNAVECLLALRVGKFEVQHAAVTFDHRQAVEFAGGIAVGQGAEVAPVDLALHARFGFEADKGRLGCGAWAHAAEIVPDNGDPAVKSMLFQALAHDHGRDLRVDS